MTLTVRYKNQERIVSLEKQLVNLDMIHCDLFLLLKITFKGQRILRGQSFSTIEEIRVKSQIKLEWMS